MVNNSTNVTKTNNILLQTIEQKTPRHVSLEIKVVVWDSHKNMAGLKWLMGSPLSPSVQITLPSFFLIMFGTSFVGIFLI
jgi:hypothetical protein